MKTVVVKIGGSTVDAEGLLMELGQNIKMVVPEVFPVIVHGGGKDIARHLKMLNREFTFVEGMRVTDAEMVKIVQMVLSGDVNKRIVNALLVAGVAAAGFSGVDGELFTASRMTVNGSDIGFVGKIDRVSPSIIEMCRKVPMVPVISPISRDAAGCIYNVNADLAAGECAMALEADDLIFVSDIAGVMIDNVVQGEIRIPDIEKLIEDGHITGGMIPKLRSAADAVRRGVKRVHICGWYGNRTLCDVLDGAPESGTVIY